MDIRTLEARPTDAEKEAIDAVIGPPDSAWDGGEFTASDGRVAFGGHSARARRTLLLPALHAAQDAVGGVSKGALAYICERLTVPPAEAYGVATFYALFDVDRTSEATTHLCDDIVCAGRGAAELGEALREQGHEWVPSPCLGQCERAPALMRQVAGDGYTVEAPADARNGRVDLSPAADSIPQSPDGLRLLRRIAGRVSATDLSAYRDAGGLDALERALELGPEGVIAELKASNLKGRGGAAFPIGAKWRGLADAAPGPKYVIANGDESEPGTFKDRVLMEGDPFALVESLVIYGYATGASSGYIYVRGEYPTAEDRLRRAIDVMRAEGLLGKDILGSGLVFDLELRRGAGAYICGEETALFASIEGHRGEPRQKPPFPTQHGVFGKPTGINNIETLLAMLEVLTIGGEEFAAIGTKDSTGPKLFCVSGDVTTPGVYEVPFGTPLGELLELAGGDPGAVSAVLLGGAAGSFVGPESLDMPLSIEGARRHGTTIGSGAVVVFDRGTDFAPVLRRIARFFRDESCGQCVPCRIGTVRQEEALARLEASDPLDDVEGELERLDDLARVMTDASICGLGQTAASAVQSAISLGLPGAPGAGRR